MVVRYPEIGFGSKYNVLVDMDQLEIGFRLKYIVLVDMDQLERKKRIRISRGSSRNGYKISRNGFWI